MVVAVRCIGSIHAPLVYWSAPQAFPHGQDLVSSYCLLAPDDQCAVLSQRVGVVLVRLVRWRIRGLVEFLVERYDSRVYVDAAGDLSCIRRGRHGESNTTRVMLLLMFKTEFLLVEVAIQQAV